MYNEKVMQIFKNPKHSGEMKNPSAVGQVGNASCGDIMKVFLKIKNGVIADASFLTFGCAAAIVTSSVACGMIKGKTIEEALKVTNKDVAAELDGGLPTHKIHCSILAEEAIKAAVEDYKSKNN